LVQPLSVINLQAQANYYRDYEATPDDIITFEKEFGKIPEGGIVSSSQTLNSSDSKSFLAKNSLLKMHIW